MDIRTSAVTPQVSGDSDEAAGPLSPLPGSASPAPPPLFPAPYATRAISCIDLLERSLVLPRHITLQRER